MTYLYISFYKAFVFWYKGEFTMYLLALCLMLIRHIMLTSGFLLFNLEENCVDYKENNILCSIIMFMCRKKFSSVIWLHEIFPWHGEINPQVKSTKVLKSKSHWLRLVLWTKRNEEMIQGKSENSKCYITRNCIKLWGCGKTCKQKPGVLLLPLKVM